ncbi:MAG: hypothetical protein ACYC7G_07275 [Rudaea sp.]
MREASALRTRDLFKRASAWVPLLLSFAALALVLGRLLIYGAARAPDEDAVAHLFQLLMVVQLPIVAVFAMRHLPCATWPALRVLVLQAAAGLAALAPVFYLNW